MTWEPSWNNRRHHRHADFDVDVDARSAASARNLASAFEEDLEEEEGEVGWDAAAKRRSCSDHRRSASVELSKLSRRKIGAFKDGDGGRSWHNGRARGHCFSDANAITSGGGGSVGGRTPARQGDNVQMQELYNSLTASNELVRVLANVLGPAGALNPTAASVLAALRSELDAARQLVKQQRRRGVDGEERLLRRQLAEEVRAWKCRHREKAAAAARLVASELDGERRARRRAERVGTKLAEALAGAEASLRAATRELGLERAARARLEKVCDELASRDVGGGTEAEAEDDDGLRREAAATALEELEREREMLQVADELREERVRMKLAEARLHFEEKNAAVDRLRQELEAFLGNERREQTPAHHEMAKEEEEDHQLQIVLASEFGVHGIDPLATEKSGQEENAEAGDDDGSEGSDIELNMDGNSWTYTTTSRSRDTTAKNATSAHGSLSDRAAECGADAGAFDRRSEATRDAPEQDWAADGCSDGGTTGRDEDEDEDAERYEAIKNLREQMLAGHAFLFLSKGEADDDSDRRRRGFASHFEEDGDLW